MDGNYGNELFYQTLNMRVTRDKSTKAGIDPPSKKQSQAEKYIDSGPDDLIKPERKVLSKKEVSIFPKKMFQSEDSVNDKIPTNSFGDEENMNVRWIRTIEQKLSKRFERKVVFTQEVIGLLSKINIEKKFGFIDNENKGLPPREEIKDFFLFDMGIILQTKVGIGLVHTLLNAMRASNREIVVMHTSLGNKTPKVNIFNSTIYIRYDVKNRFFTRKINDLTIPHPFTSDTSLFHELCHAHYILKNKIKVLTRKTVGPVVERPVIGLVKGLEYTENKYREQQRELNKSKIDLWKWYKRREYL